MNIQIRTRTLIWIASLVSLTAAAAPDPEFASLSRLTLTEADRLLTLRNREIQAAKRAVEAGVVESIVAGQRPNPTLSLDASNINPSQGIGGGSIRDKFIDKTIRFEQVIERGGKQKLRIDQGTHNETASREEQVSTIREQRLALRTAYYDLLLAQEKADVLRDMAALSAQSRDAAERRLAVGDVAKAEVARIRVEALRAANDARQADAEQTRARLTLSVLVGAESSARSIRAVDSWPNPAPLKSCDIEAIVDQRSDVLAAQARVAASEAGLHLAQSTRTRDVTVGAQYEHYPVNPAFGSGSGSSYGLSVSIPLFLWHGNEGEIRKAAVEHSAALDALEKVRASARTELERTQADLADSSERVERFQSRLLGDAKTAADAAEFAYQHGATGLTDLLDARRTLRTTEIEAATAHSDYAKALTAWQLRAAEEMVTPIRKGEGDPTKEF